MTWTYSQSTGRLYAPDGTHAATCYAGGGGGKNPEAVNNHSMQDQKGVGPLPVGFYTFGGVVDHSQLGPCAITLIPDATNTMLDRGGFYCHGDNFSANQSASDGCIIAPRAVRDEIIASSDKQLAVVFILGGEG